MVMWPSTGGYLAENIQNGVDITYWFDVDKANRNCNINCRQMLNAKLYSSIVLTGCQGCSIVAEFYIHHLMLVWI